MIRNEDTSTRQSFYTITTLYLDLEKELTREHRVIGWFWTEEEAREIALTNGCDWVETGFYNYAVVEEWSKPRLYPRHDKQWWYKVEMPSGGTSSQDLVIKECEKPEMFKYSYGEGAFG